MGSDYLMKTDYILENTAIVLYIYYTIAAFFDCLSFDDLVNALKLLFYKTW